jgi:hypothetical protein
MRCNCGKGLRKRGKIAVKGVQPLLLVVIADVKQSNTDFWSLAMLESHVGFYFHTAGALCISG